MKLSQKPFTLSDWAMQEPDLPHAQLEKCLKVAQANDKLFLVGKVPRGNSKKLAYSTVPWNKLRNKYVKMVEPVGDNLSLPQRRFLKRVFTKETLREIIRHASKRTKKIVQLHDGGARTGLISDNFSTRFGTSMRDIIKAKFHVEVEISGKDNRKADLYFPHLDLKVEIKATSGKTTWLGGKWSDRPYPTLLVSYDFDEQVYFIALVPKITWPQIADGFYGPPLAWSELRDKYPEKTILFGGISEGDRGQMIREAI